MNTRMGCEFITMKWFLKKKKQFLSFLLSYIAFFIFFLAVCSYVYYRVILFIEAEVINSHYSTISQLSQSVDSKLSEMELILSDIILNKEINSQSSLEKTPSSHGRAALQKIPNQLRIYPVTRQYIEDVFVSYPNRDMVVSGNGTCDISEYFSIYYSNVVNNGPELIQSLSERNLNRIVVIRREENGIETKDLLLLRSLEYEPNIAERSNAGVLLSDDFFNNIFNSLKIERLGHILLLTDANDIIYTSGEISDEDLNRLKHFDDSKGIFQEKVNGLTNKIIYATDSRGVKYLAIIPVNLFAEKADPIKNIMLYSILIYILFGVAGAFLFAFRNYKPVQSIISKLAYFGKIDANSHKNEYAMIENIISNIINENQVIERSFNKQKDMLRDFFLLKLLKGHPIENLSEDDVLATYNIHFPDDAFIVIMLYLENMPTADGFSSENDEIELAHFILQNVVEECLSQQSLNICCFEAEGGLFVIVNVDSKDDVEDQLRNALNKAHKAIFDHFSINFSSFISNKHDMMIGISECYQECMETAEYKIVLGADEVSFYKDTLVNDNIGINAIYPFELQQKFTNLVKAGEFSGAEELINTVFDKIYKREGMSLDEAKCLMFAIINTMVNIYEDSMFLETFDTMKKLVKCKSLSMLHTEMTKILAYIEANHIEKQKKDSSGKIMGITNYIRENSCDMTLSLTSIADFFDMNPSYLSRYYKEQTGEGILYTINKIRVDKAKKLLAEGSLTLKEIAQQSGFVNDTVLIRTFKKYEGVTPGNFRKI